MSGGVTGSIFPEVEAYFDADSDRRKGLEYVAARKDMDRYHSVMDFLFCESFTQHRAACLRFYDDEGKPLRDLISEEKRAEYAAHLLYIVEQAHAWYSEKRRQSWSAFRSEVVVRRVA